MQQEVHSIWDSCNLSTFRNLTSLLIHSLKAALRLAKQIALSVQAFLLEHKTLMSTESAQQLKQSNIQYAMELSQENGHLTIFQGRSGINSALVCATR